MEKNKLRDFKERILYWSLKNLRDFPWRQNMTPYRVLVAELLLRRTTAKAVERIYPKFLEKYPDLNELAYGKKEDLLVLLKQIGYHNERASIIIAIAKDMLCRFDGDIPESMEALSSIKNIGHYTAGAVRSLGYGKKGVMLDSNVKRVLKRVFEDYLSQNCSEKKMLDLLTKIVPDDEHQIFNLGLIDFGAAICTHAQMRHEVCPVKHICDFYQRSFAKRNI